jgi:hypothetical protein
MCGETHKRNVWTSPYAAVSTARDGFEEHVRVIAWERWGLPRKRCKENVR